MSGGSDTSVSLNIYEEKLDEETTSDLSNQGLGSVPTCINKQLRVLYLQNNKITSLPDDFFPSLPSLMWLDIRDNLLTNIPTTIQNHQSLTYLLLQNNKITSLPNELGSIVSLKVLQLAGNPLTYPPSEILNAGTSIVIRFLHDKYVENVFLQSQSDTSEDTASTSRNDEEQIYHQEVRSYNSVIDQEKIENKTLSVKFGEKECDDSDEEYYTKIKGKCPKLPRSRTKTLPSHSQSFKYLKALRADSGDVINEKIKQNYFREKTLRKHKDFLATRDKILQDRKNIDLLRNWRQMYKYRKQMVDGSYKLDPNNYPYDTNPECMNFLTREDIEKDLPNKYKKKLFRKCKPSVPRKSNSDVHLAMKIKQLFENLEAIDLNRDAMTPRTEQKVLLNEIQKISEIKQKLMELSTTNTLSVPAD